MRVDLSPEVASALREGRPVVALETSVVAHGLPAPHNLAAATACEAAVRRAGAVPATVAVVDGRLRAGLDAAEIERLASGADDILKVGSRDLAWCIAQRRTGGTTVSATCAVAAGAGIRVMATGGIGGVHRGVSEHMDVSQDLPAIARLPVAVVCAGAKSVLDLPKTLEVLETMDVPVVGVGTDELPSFHSRTSGLRLDQRVDDAAAAARLAHVRFDELGQGGIVFALPPPAHVAMDPREVEEHMRAALHDAEARGVTGKRVTPFLLGELARRSGGRTVTVNLALLEANAAFAAELAAAYLEG